MSLKNYIGFSLDFSASMQSLRSAAAADYNSNIALIKQEATNHEQDTIVSVVKNGMSDGKSGHGVVQRWIQNSSANALQVLNVSDYGPLGGSTPLFDSVGELISMFEQVPDAKDQNVSFLIQVITDGEENSSKTWTASKLAAKIRQLQATDRWTFVFRVPRGYGRSLAKLGIPDGNILEWDVSSKGYEQATTITSQAMSSYYTARATGQKSTGTFFASLAQVDDATIKTTLVDISDKVNMLTVPGGRDVAIRDFIEGLGLTYVKGTLHYELVKPEPKVQDYKQLIIRDQNDGKFYGGNAARQLLGLPTFGTCRLRPGDTAHYDVFVQSTSFTRKLPANTRVVIWDSSK